MRGRFSRDSEAVSSTIGTIINVVIVLMLASVVVVWAMSFTGTLPENPVGGWWSDAGDEDDGTPKYEFTHDFVDDNIVITIWHGDGRGWPLLRNVTDYRLYNETGSIFRSGHLEDVRVGPGPVPPESLRSPEDGSMVSHIQWLDANDDWRLTGNDRIWLLGADNRTWHGQMVEPGYADAGWRIDLLHRPTGKVIISVVIEDH